MSTTNYAKDGCEICGRRNNEMPTIFRGTGRCSVICQKATAPRKPAEPVVAESECA